MTKHNYLPPVNLKRRPFWSVMIPTYNCSKYLGETLQSVLDQDPGKELMQIEVVDDCSSDNPEKIVDSIGKGRVSFYRQTKNVGHIRNFETALNRSIGEVVHILHGDDKILDGFYESFKELLEHDPEIMAAFCRHSFIDSEGIRLSISRLETKTTGVYSDFFSEQLKRQQVQTPSIVVRRKVYEDIGMFRHDLSWTEDWEMWARIGKHYKVGYVVKPLAEYRVHSNSNTAERVLSGEYINDYERLRSVLVELSPEREKSNTYNHINKAMVKYALNSVRQLIDIDPRCAEKQLNRVFFISTQSRKDLLKKLKLYLLIWSRRFRIKTVKNCN